MPLPLKRPSPLAGRSDGDPSGLVQETVPNSNFATSNATVVRIWYFARYRPGQIYCPPPERRSALSPKKKKAFFVTPPTWELTKFQGAGIMRGNIPNGK